jgi:phosphatidylglycerophosphatase A
LKQPVTKFLASGAFFGYVPGAPGTLGTLWGVPIFYGISRYALGIQAGVSVLFILAAVFLSGRAARAWGRKDPSRVVIDETAGYLVAVCGLPFTWITVLGGFFIFRVLDIFKPFPIRKIDREMAGGWGIVLDDVLAGIYTNILLRLVMAFTG